MLQLPTSYALKPLISNSLGRKVEGLSAKLGLMAWPGLKGRVISV
ncbi:hypothetical protein GFS31_12770 [Leptolyngbya sp. BL0902]|nr:hypothetical protein GFS31_12770 [Leptolyngbya sp. BL0902]